jgi:hypothetical protein
MASRLLIMFLCFPASDWTGPRTLVDAAMLVAGHGLLRSLFDAFVFVLLCHMCHGITCSVRWLLKTACDISERPLRWASAIVCCDIWHPVFEDAYKRSWPNRLIMIRIVVTSATLVSVCVVHIRLNTLESFSQQEYTLKYVP